MADPPIVIACAAAFMIAVATALGFLALRWIDPLPALRRGERAVLAAVLGFIQIAAFGMARAWAGRTVVWCAMLAFALWSATRRRRVPVEAKRAGAPKERAATVLAALLVAVASVRVLSTVPEPVLDGDEATIWSAKAIAIHTATELRLPLREVIDEVVLVSHADYPAFLPSLQVFWFDVVGRPSCFGSRLPAQLLDIAFVAFAFSFLRRRVGPGAAALVTLYLVVSVEFWLGLGTGMCDNLVAAGMFLCAAALSVAPSDRPRTSAAGVALGALVMAWSKNEGILHAASWLAAAAAVFLSGQGSLRARLGHLALAALPPAAIVAVRSFVNSGLGAESGLVSGMLAPTAGEVLALAKERALPLVRHAGADFFLDLAAGGPFVAGCALFALAGYRVRRLRQVWIGCAALTIGMMGLVAVFMLTPYDLEWHWSTAGRRVFAQLVPASLCLWCAAAAVHRDSARAPAGSAAAVSAPGGSGHGGG